MFCSIRLFGLATADGRKRLLRRTLTGALATVSAHRTTAPAGLQQRMRENHVLNAYLGELDEAAARSDGNGVRDLADELPGHLPCRRVTGPRGRDAAAEPGHPRTDRREQGPGRGPGPQPRLDRGILRRPDAGRARFDGHLGLAAGRGHGRDHH
jgi:hypothetical protein